MPAETTPPVGDLEAGADAFWGSLREQLGLEAVEAVEYDGVHPDDWAAAAEACVRAARGERDPRPFTTRPELVREAPAPAPAPRWNYFSAGELVLLTKLLNWVPDLPFDDDERRTADKLRGSLSDEVMSRTVGQEQNSPGGPE